MGLKYTENIEINDKSSQIYVCKNCKTHLLKSDWIESYDFRGIHGDAFYSNKLINYLINKNIKIKEMMTGYYQVKSINCYQCLLEIGWKYIKANDPSQKYKENKFVIE
ncbi:yippee-like protein, partial [Ascoidea rubescens DSM 1968]